MNNETQTSRYNIGQKIASVFLSAAILTTGFVGLGTVTATQADAASTNDYGLVDNIQDGTILHCFCWKYNDIKAMLPDIAEAGFSAIQVSPPQQTAGSGSWWWVYQPLGFYIGNTALGSKEDLRSLCTEADKYGIKIVADVVANHLAGDHSNIQSDLKDSQYWHPDIGDSVDGDRYKVTHGKIGMPDLNTEHSYVQQCVKNYIQELKSVGVDGIRFDAAKHIGLPSEGDNFWKTVTADTDLWYYGEILNNPGVTDEPRATNILKEYNNYMSVTDSTYGMTLRDSFGSGTAPSSYGNLCAKGIANDKILYWGESHDTWSNNADWGYSWKYDQNVIDRAYAVAASRNEITALYFSRPSTHVKDDITLGSKGSTHFTSPEVAEVNKFHNAMVGQKDYYTTGSNCSVVCREKGAVIVAGSGSNKEVSVPNGGGTTAPGTYTDQITGKTWTVTATTISGYIGSTGIAVIYNPDDNPVSGGVSASPSTGTSFTDTLSVTLNAKDVSNAKYTTSEGASGSYTDGQTITVGSSTSEGSSVTVTLTGTKSDGSTATATYTYKKTAPKQYPTLDGSGFVFDNSSKNWSTVNAYVYDESGSSVVANASWPGVKMTDCGNGYWKYELDSKFTSSSNVKVIFNNGSTQIPAAQQPGFDMKGTDKKLYEDDTWKDLPATSSLKASLSASASTVQAGNSVTFTASATGGTGTISYEFKQGSTTIQSSSTKSTCTWTPSTKGTYTITVTAKDSSTSKTATATTTITVTAAATTDPVVNVNKESGTVFTTETLDVTLTLSNAVSGTYSVDNGPTKTFTGSKTVTLGQGKIGDSTVTLKATATNSSGTTKTYTFTYEKDYVVKTSSSSATLASQYKTNPNGTGANKTISVDGDISDWDSSMLIAQGAANDDPRVYRPNSMYELPIDLYALYAAYDDNNLYLMWEMTNVQDVVAPNDNYPLSQGILWQTQELPFFIAIDTGDSSTAIGNDGQLITGGTIWDSGMTITSSFNKLISINTKGGNGPFVYGGDSTGLNPVEILDAKTSKIKMSYGLGILSDKVTGINGAYGENNNRVVGDVCNDSADWVDFNTLGHSSKTMDFFYELSIPYSELGITKSDVESNGVGVLLVATFGKSGMDCLPYDTSMNDNADLDDAAGSQENNSFEKSDADNITCAFARVGNGSTPPEPPIPPTTPLQVNFGTDRSAPQLTTTALTLKAVGYGGTAPYKYQFYVDGTTVKSNSTTDSCSWTPTAGTHTLKCVITDSTGATATVTKTFTAEAAGEVTELKNSSTISKTTITKGDSITIKASATGGTAPYQYAMSVKHSTATGWTSIKSYSTTATKTWTPAKTGTYSVCAKVKDADDTEVKKFFTLKVNSASTPLANSSTISKTTITKGDSVTIKAVATGGTSPYKYAMSVKHSTASSWTTIKSYSTTATKTWTPASTGTYQVCAKVKDAKGTEVKKFFTLKVNAAAAALKNTSTISKTAINKGETVTIKASATGGTSPYQYAMTVKHSTATSWTSIKSYSTTTTRNWTPAKTGTYQVCAKVKDAKGTEVKKFFTLTVNAASTALTNNSTISSTSVTKGNSIALKAAATGGTSPYQYSFLVKHSTATSWTTIKSYSTTATKTWAPAKTGTYSVCAKVKDAKGTEVRKFFTLTVK